MYQYALTKKESTVEWRYCKTAAIVAVRSKLLMLLAPFLRRWTYTRVAEQVSNLCLTPFKCCFAVIIRQVVSKFDCSSECCLWIMFLAGVSVGKTASSRVVHPADHRRAQIPPA